MTHEATIEHVSDLSFAAVCECGHRSEGPNPDTAGKRHQIHVNIQEARAALRGDKEDAG